MDQEEQVVQNEAEGTAEQESPTVEQNQPEVEEPKEDAAETPQDRNWKALREENERLKAQLSGKTETPSESKSTLSQRKDLDVFMSDEDKMRLSFREERAEAEFSDVLKADPILSRAVQGEYINALSEYNQAVMQGRSAPLPDPYKITKQVKEQFDTRFGAVSKKAEVEGAKKAKEAKESKEATVEAEGRSDRGRSAKATEELGNLQVRTRRGDSSALAERLSRSGL